VNKPYLPERIIYNWADIYSQQLKSGDDYSVLKPTYSIWLLAENLLKKDEDYWHCYKLRDDKGDVLTAGGIWLLELQKFHANLINNEQQRWLQFFKDGEELDDADLPEWMATNEMRQAMNTLTVFSEKERAYFQYQARQEYLREQRTTQKVLQQEQLEKALAVKEKDEALQEKEAALEREKIAQQEKAMAFERERIALAEIQQLKALLAQNVNIHVAENKQGE